jgi:hypothetical protein
MLDSIPPYTHRSGSIDPAHAVPQVRLLTVCHFVAHCPQQRSELAAGNGCVHDRTQVLRAGGPAGRKKREMGRTLLEIGVQIICTLPPYFNCCILLPSGCSLVLLPFPRPSLPKSSPAQPTLHPPTHLPRCLTQAIRIAKVTASHTQAPPLSLTNHSSHHRGLR